MERETARDRELRKKREESTGMAEEIENEIEMKRKTNSGKSRD